VLDLKDAVLLALTLLVGVIALDLRIPRTRVAGSSYWSPVSFFGPRYRRPPGALESQVPCGGGGTILGGAIARGDVGMC
jgi:hypothetical protein